jgi:hypothetical protein
MRTMLGLDPNTSISLVAVLAVPLVAWELITGKVINGLFRVYATRQDSPMTYWLSLFGQTLLTGCYWWWTLRRGAG